MLTKENVKEKYGENITFLFKGSEPFTSVNGAPGGVLLEKNGEICCYECGEWFKSVGGHLKKHKMTVKEYRLKYGYNSSSGLCTKELSQTISLRTRKNKPHLSIKSKLFKPSKVNTSGKTGIKNSLQAQNKGNTCPEQMKRRMELLVSLFGAKITANEIRKNDPNLLKWAEKNFKTFNNFKTLLNLTPTKRGHHKNETTEAELVYDLRNYIKEYGNIPWKRIDGALLRLNNFPHSKYVYYYRFGSMAKVYAHCGIEKKGYKQFQIL